MKVKLVDTKPAVVQIEGEVDLSNVAEVKAVLGQALEQADNGLVVDLTEATYLDSAGIAALVSAYQKVRARNSVLAAVVSDNYVKRILLLVHLDRLPYFFLTEDIESAKERVEHR